MDKKLHRSQTDKIIAGVAGGIGEYFEVDPTIVRLIFVLITVLGGSGIFLYLVLWVLIPKDAEGKIMIDKDRVKEVAQEIKGKAETLHREMKEGFEQSGTEHGERHHKRGGGLFGWILIIIGIMLVLNTLNLHWWHFYSPYFWPGVLIVLGMILIIRGRRRI
jgi:phage shock protein C